MYKSDKAGFTRGYKLNESFGGSRASWLLETLFPDFIQAKLAPAAGCTASSSANYKTNFWQQLLDQRVLVRDTKSMQYNAGPRQPGSERYSELDNSPGRQRALSHLDRSWCCRYSLVCNKVHKISLRNRGISELCHSVSFCFQSATWSWRTTTSRLLPSCKQVCFPPLHSGTLSLLS